MPEKILTRFGGNHRLLVGYLAEEVMADLPEAVAAFLTRTALVERFCAPLGDALLADSPWPASSHTSLDFTSVRDRRAKKDPVEASYQAH